MSALFAAVNAAYDDLMAAADFSQAEQRYEYLTMLIDSIPVEAQRVIMRAHILARIEDDEAKEDA